MKKVIFLLMISTGINSCSKELTCSDFKNGKFLIPADSLVEISYTVIRKNSQQIEINEEGKKIILDIKYIDDCNYVLSPSLRSKGKNNDPNLSIGDLTVEVIEIQGRTMYYKSRWKIDSIDNELPGKIVKIK